MTTRFWQKNISRRAAMKVIGGTTSLLFAPNFFPSRSFALGTDFLSRTGPIDRGLPDLAPREFFGDRPEHPHSVLWDKAGYIQKIGGLPSATEEVPLVIVGGGLSGLTTAYLLREHNPVVLEQAARFGGNAKGMSWRGIDFSLGAAYFIEPDFETDLGKLCLELGLDKAWRVKSEEDPVEVGGKIFSEFWGGQTTDGDKSQFERLAEYFRTVNEGEDIAFPDIPIEDPEQNDYINTLDRLSFLDHLKEKAGGELHPHIETAIEHYCWSSFGGSASEISAAGGLNFYASEFSNLVVFPGGNAGAAEIILQKVHSAIGEERLRPSSLVFDVRAGDDGAFVSYLQTDGTVKTIKAKAVVMACPKFVCGRIIDGIEADRLAAIQKMRYRSYLVANVLLNVESPDPVYDLYLLGKGSHRANNPRELSNEQGATDVIVASFAKPNVDKHTVLTLYRGVPYDGARAELLVPTSYDKYRKEFENQFSKDIEPLLHAGKMTAVDFRISRWGHPLPLSATGLIADGTLEKARAPFRERVFFVEQDNWALPAFETAVTEALTSAPKIKEFLGGSGT